jgi:hypothetical protein
MLLEFMQAATRHQFFMTTHSNHFLDMTMDYRDMSIFSFRKAEIEHGQDVVPKFYVERVESGTQSVLEQLGVRNSSVFLVNATIWVEGITDRLYIRKALQLFQDTKTKDRAFRRIDEDLHFSFVEYGGSAITHWSFLAKDSAPPTIDVTKLCSRLLLIVDADDPASRKERHAQLKALLQDRLVILPGREIENLLSPRTIRAVVSQYEGKEPEMGKFEREAYQSIGLGKFIESRLKDKKRKASYGETSGTIADKVRFCERAIEHMGEDDLVDGFQSLIETIYEFVAEQNGFGDDGVAPLPR